MLAVTEPVLESYDAYLEKKGISLSTMAVDDKGTLMMLPMSDATLGKLLPGLDAVLDGSALEIHGIIGAGGMGVIRSATQRSLDREVAVKSVKNKRSSDRARAQLYREAWVTGRLEHPNIVPVYALGQNADKSLAFVMKHIEGVPWSHVIHRPHLHVDLLEGTDPISFHLDVFETVCQAIHYAHDRGVLHRDIKPDNVMLGRFGEVYVLDWGIAVGLGTEQVGPLPPASEIRGVEGTPSYMAPEMARADATLIGLRSDVYLLGAVLHEILVREPLHDGGSVTEVLEAAYQSDPPVYPDDISPELGAIVIAATHHDPANRFSSVDALRRAVVAYSEHRASEQLSTEGAQRDAQLVRLLEAAEPDQVEIARLSAGARFGFEQALKAWPGNHLARIGLDALGDRMVRHELHAEQPNSAEAWLELLSAPPEELVAQIVDLRRRLVDRKTEVVALVADANATRGATTRAYGAFASGVLMSVGSVGVGVAEMMTEWRSGYTAPVVVTSLYAAYLLSRVWRSWGKHNRSTRNQIAIANLAAGGLLGVMAICWFAGADVVLALALCALVSVLATVQLAFMVRPQMGYAAAVYAAGAVAILVLPQYLWFVQAASLFVGFATIAAVWYSAGDRRDQT